MAAPKTFEDQVRHCPIDKTQMFVIENSDHLFMAQCPKCQYLVNVTRDEKGIYIDSKVEFDVYQKPLDSGMNEKSGTLKYKSDNKKLLKSC